MTARSPHKPARDQAVTESHQAATRATEGTLAANSRPAKPRILLAMITVGNGHKAPADALKAGIEQLYPGTFEVDVLDFTLAVGDAAFDRRHKASWDRMLARPASAYWGQRFIDSVPASWVRLVTEQLLRRHAASTATYMKKSNYSLVVASHFFTLQALAIARARHGLEIPLVGLNTDPFDAHVMWAERRADELIVSSKLARTKLEQKGVASNKISIFGYPLGLAFLEQTLSKAEARHKLNLHPDKLTILQSAGGEGIGGQLEDFVKAALAADLELQYVVACGRNETLHSYLNDLAATHEGKLELRPEGFITNMEDWITASDLVLGKAGAATTFEALALNRPIFHTSYAAYNERTNIDYCIRAGIGRYVNTPAELVTVLQGFVTDKSDLVMLSESIRALAIAPGTLDIAKHLIETYIR